VYHNLVTEILLPLWLSTYRLLTILEHPVLKDVGYIRVKSALFLNWGETNKVISLKKIMLTVINYDALINSC